MRLVIKLMFLCSDACIASRDLQWMKEMLNLSLSGSEISADRKLNCLAPIFFDKAYERLEPDEKQQLS